jgi:hypothetical protein
MYVFFFLECVVYVRVYVCYVHAHMHKCRTDTNVFTYSQLYDSCILYTYRQSACTKRRTMTMSISSAGKGTVYADVCTCFHLELLRSLIMT